MTKESDYLKSLHALHQQQERIRKLNKLTEDFKAGNLQPEELYEQLFGVPPQSKGSFQEKYQRVRDILEDDTPPEKKWGSVDEMMRDLQKQRAARPAPPVPSKPVDPEARKREINHELDIIRGRVPTPVGYKVDPSKVKALMAELKQLS